MLVCFLFIREIIFGSVYLLFFGSVRGVVDRLADLFDSYGEWSIKLNSTEFSEMIKQRFAKFIVVSDEHNEGTIVSVSDGVIRIHGLA
ncbi:hypothetical protein, partial [Enterobacter sichuanensis]